MVAQESVYKRGLVVNRTPSTICKDEEYFEGYNNAQDWLNALREKRKEYEGLADSAKSNYGTVITDNEYNQLASLEKKLINGSSFESISTLGEQYNELINGIAARVPQITYSGSGGNSYSGRNWSGSLGAFMQAGRVESGGNVFTYYSQSVLPGGGLSIPGRHVEDGFVKDKDGYICVANSAPNGTTINTPWGAGKVYDKGTSGNHYDIYIQ